MEKDTKNKSHRQNQMILNANQTKQQKKRRLKSFKQTKTKTWKCGCGGLNDKIICPNCGHTKHSKRKEENIQTLLDILKPPQ